MPATLYRWDDTSAPAFSTTAGWAYDVIKAVLITGYGSRTPVGGWTIAFEDAVNHKIALKHNSEEIYIRINAGIDYRYLQIDLYTAMTDIDTGTGRIPNDSAVTQSHMVASTAYTSSTDNWTMLVDQGGDWVYFMNWQTSYPAGFFFGKITGFDGFTQRWMVTGYDSTSILSSAAPYTLWTSPTPLKAAHVDKNKWNIQGASCDVAWIRPPETMEQPDPQTGKLLFTREYIRTYDSPYVILGAFPNRLVSWGSISNPGWVPHDLVTIGAKTYIVFIYSYTYLFEYDSNSG